MNSDPSYLATPKAVKNYGRKWPVYKHYEIVEESGTIFVVAPLEFASFFEPVTEANRNHPEEVGQLKGQRLGGFVGRDPIEDAMTSYPPTKSTYVPLQAPELVVELAQLADKEITPQSVLSWAEVYGLLGMPGDDIVKLDQGFMKFEVKGDGRREDVQRFAEAAREIRACLRVYEAAIAEQEPNLGALLSDVGSSFPPLTWRHWTRRQGRERSWLFGVLGSAVQTNLHQFCYPQFNIFVRDGDPTGRFALSWGYKGLIGAIWLQMAWLLEADSDQVVRCKLLDCLRVIRFESGKSADELGSMKDVEGTFKKNARGKYKTRVDREFCKDRPCKQKYHYRKNAGWPGYS